MDTNRVICRNEVYIEDIFVGQFERFEMQGNSRTLGKTATLTLPLYALGAGSSDEPRARVRGVFKDTLIKPFAKVSVFCWYEGYEKIRVFAGFIEHIGEGFPTKLYLQDNAFILRLGNIQKIWNEDATLQQIATDVIPVANEAFKNERERQGFTLSIPDLQYSGDDQNVQAVTTSLSFRNWSARAPYDTVKKLMELLVLYGGVTDDYNLYIGSGAEDTSRPVTQLDTRYNVIERDIVPVDGRFVDYNVKITGVLSNGRQYTATGGYGTSRSTETKSQFEKTYGENFRGFSPLKTVEGIQEMADRQLQMLKGFRNKGNLGLLMYPKINLLDQVTYNDTLFPELSGLYYVLEYQFSADEKGYYQKLGVTDQIFNL